MPQTELPFRVGTGAVSGSSSGACVRQATASRALGRPRPPPPAPLTDHRRAAPASRAAAGRAVSASTAVYPAPPSPGKERLPPAPSPGRGRRAAACRCAPRPPHLAGGPRAAGARRCRGRSARADRPGHVLHLLGGDVPRASLLRGEAFRTCSPAHREVLHGTYCTGRSTRGVPLLLGILPAPRSRAPPRGARTAVGPGRGAGGRRGAGARGEAALQQACSAAISANRPRTLAVPGAVPRPATSAGCAAAPCLARPDASMI